MGYRLYISIYIIYILNFNLLFHKIGLHNIWLFAVFFYRPIIYNNLMFVELRGSPVTSRSEWRHVVTPTKLHRIIIIVVIRDSQPLQTRVTDATVLRCLIRVILPATAATWLTDWLTDRHFRREVSRERSCTTDEQRLRPRSLSATIRRIFYRNATPKPQAVCLKRLTVVDSKTTAALVI